MNHKFIKLVVLLTALACLLLTSCGSDRQMESTESANEDPWGTEVSETEMMARMPWEVDGAKAPKDYTMEEYEALTDAQQEAFQKYLGAVGYAMWLEQTASGVYPWDLPKAKQPEEYTWDEYQALTETQKKAFMEYLGPYGLEEWLNKSQNQSVENPWSEPGAKQPRDYVLSEYESLTEDQQIAFEENLGVDGFQQWIDQNQAQVQEPEQGLRPQYPWELDGAKQPGDYSWAEYNELPESQKIAFQEHLGADSFGTWIKKVFQQDDAPNWDVSGTKNPQDYTWEEFSALSTEQQMAFQNHLGAEAFEAWLSQAQGQPSVNPWDISGAKQPTEYTWGEFEALPADQQISFQNYMGQEAFDVWLNRVQAQTAEHPWNDPSAKQPADYTWEEFKVLPPAQQMAFQNHLGDEAFEAWLSQAQGQQLENPWEAVGAKQPTEYAWEEFEALTADQQIDFQNYMGQEAFEVWFNGALGQTAENPWDDRGAKQPADYTWEEFEALAGAQQIAFQTYLGSEAFGAWLNRVQNQTIENPWELSGAKQPEDYTWEEFEALTGTQQMAFQNYLGPEAFDAWLNRVQ